jgi:hypothetical protein
MKKIFILLAIILTVSCSSSSDDSPQLQPEPINTNGSILINGQTYTFNTAEILKFVGGYKVILWNTQKTVALELVIATPSVDLMSATYTYDPIFQSQLSQAKFWKDITSTTSTQLLNSSSDFIGTQSRVIVSRHDNTIYSFSINFITTLGTITGNYSGSVTKIGF